MSNTSNIRNDLRSERRDTILHRISLSQGEETPVKPEYVPYRKEFPLDVRQKESSRIKIKYPESVPVICEPASSDPDLFLEKHKFLVPGHLTMGQFIFTLRTKLSFDKSEALFVFIETPEETMVVPHSGKTIQHFYDENVLSDGFLYIRYSKEQTFGA